MAAKLPQVDVILQAGIDPKTGLPIKLGTCGCQLKDDIRKQLRILDEQDAINRYVWYNLPDGLTGQMLERILYYKGQAAFFYMKSNNTFYFLPYALSGTIDVYGRFQGITPLPFNGTSQTNEKGKVKPWIEGLHKTPIYSYTSILTADDIMKAFTEGCVLLNDYSKQLSETIIPRQIIQDPLLDVMAETIPFARTSLLANSGVKGVRVPDESSAESVSDASRVILNSALTGNPLVPIISNLEFQDLTNGSALKSEEYLLYLQALDNYRLSLYGLETGGLFQKKSHMLEAEQNMNAKNAKLAYTDGLTLRQNFCDLVNGIWGLGIKCLPSEAASQQSETELSDKESNEVEEESEDVSTDEE